MLNDLTPELIPAELVAAPTWLQCGACGFSGEVEYYIFCDGPECFTPICNCPIAAVLEA